MKTLSRGLWNHPRMTQCFSAWTHAEWGIVWTQSSVGTSSSMWSSLRPLPHSALQRFYKTDFYTEICAKARGAVSRPAGRSTFSWFLSGLTGGTQFHVPLVRVEVHPAPHLYFNLFQSNCLKNVMKRLLRGLRHSECWEWWCCSHCSRRRIPGDDHTETEISTFPWQRQLQPLQVRLWIKTVSAVQML